MKAMSEDIGFDTLDVYINPKNIEMKQYGQRIMDKVIKADSLYPLVIKF